MCACYDLALKTKWACSDSALLLQTGDVPAATAAVEAAPAEPAMLIEEPNVQE